MKFNLIIDKTKEEHVDATLHSKGSFAGRLEELVLSYSGEDSITAYTEDVIERDNVRTDVSMTKGRVNRFTYDFVGMLGYKDFALFAKFYPKSSRFVPEGGVKFDYWTLGISFFL